ncbi:hypothetical protein [Amycolatopsis sp. NPDC051903]|uniref:hypothetical protein n=1 Tax=Amycolatopsis sp. NPDC051903 TaxID=3363936 RepID=UPI00378DD2F0
MADLRAVVCRCGVIVLIDVGPGGRGDGTGSLPGQSWDNDDVVRRRDQPVRLSTDTPSTNRDGRAQAPSVYRVVDNESRRPIGATLTLRGCELRRAVG